MISEIYLHDTSRMDNEIETPVCTLELGSPLYFSKDGFEPSEVLFPHAAFHFPSKDKKEAYDFIDKIVEKHRPVCDGRHRLGLKRQTLEARIARA
ncbi:hypothetical protein AtEden1_Chr2g0230401 [Arabidopsis thaliana]